MSYLRCNAHNCSNNKNDLCVLREIQVDGSYADRRDGTFCSSFTEANDNYSNIVTRNSEPKPETDIGCDARNCSFNKDCKCVSPSVDISGVTAHCCSDTQCSTFDCRKK